MSEPLHVLYVDDDGDLLDLAADVLERNQDRFRVRTATSASEGMDILDHANVDCVVSDYEMPGEDGIAFLETVREEHPALPFILFTGKGSEEIASEAISAGVSDYLQKGGTDQFAVLANRIRNLVEKYRAEQARDRHQLLVEEATDVILVVDTNGTIQYATPSAESILGRSADELEGSNGFAPVHPDDMDQVMAEFEALAERPGGRRTVEFRYERPDGSVIWAEARGRNLLDRPNVGGIVVYVRDVTERKQHEQELERYETFVETVADGVFAQDANAQYSFVNSYIEEKTGLDREQIIGEDPTLFLDEAEIRDISAAIGDMLEGSRETVTFETDISTGDDETVPAEGRLALLPGDGEFEGTVGMIRDISTQKERERELERYKILVREVTDSIGVIDADGTIKYENPAISRILGYEPDELEGENAFEYMHPDDRDAVMERFFELVNDDTEEVARIEYRMKHADGSWRWLESEASNQLETVLDGYVITSRDVTRRKERERELERYGAIVRSMADTAFVIDSDWRLEFANKTALEYADLALSDVKGTPVMDLAREMTSSDEDNERLETALERVFEANSGSEPPEKVQIELDLPTGALTAEFQLSQFTIGGETKVVVNGRDITDHQRREEAFTELQEATRDFMEKSDRQEVAELAVEATPAVLEQHISGIWFYEETADALEPVAMTDRSDVVVGDSPTFTRGEGLAWRAYETGEVGVYNDLSDEPQRYNPETNIESELILPLGQHGVMIIGRTDRYEFDTVDEALARTLANTVEAALDRADRESRLQDQHEELQQKNERLDRFASILSHDLRNPLSVAQGRVELLKDEDTNSEHLEAISRAHQRMEALIDDILTISKQRETEMDTDPVSLEEISMSCWQNVDTAEANLQVESDRTVRVNKGRFKQLMENLLRNAIEHGGEDVVVTMGDLEDGFYVEDDGVGFPETGREDLFEAGQTTKEDGTGFGLSIVEQVAKAHGWDVHVTDGEDGGARFEFTGIESA